VKARALLGDTLARSGLPGRREGMEVCACAEEARRLLNLSFMPLAETVEEELFRQKRSFPRALLR